MTLRVPQLQFLVAWSDADITEICVTAKSERFAGQANMYVGPDELTNLANLIHGFPSTTQDVRQFNLGQPLLEGYGSASIRMWCKDATGHIVVQVEVRSTPSDLNTESESCVVQLFVVPSDIDRFEGELRSVSNEIGHHATLQNAV
jgi:hypothetical protein